ncbi:MAG: TldD/PmbA family protein [Candidatus Thorarchaeota archaeon]|jgi:PmbA protein
MEFDNLKDELLSVTDTGLKYAKSLDSSAEFEVFVFYDNTIEASIDQGMVTAKDGAIAGTAVRAAKGTRVGFACASGYSADRIKLTAREALSIVESVNVEDDRFKGFCDPSKPGKEGAFSKDILSLGTDELLVACEEIIEEAKAVDPRAKIISANADAGWSGYAVGNSRGVLGATVGGNNSCMANVYAIEGEERRGSFDFDVARDRLFKTEGIGKKTAEQAVSLLGAKKLDLTTKLPTIWTPIPAATYLLSSLGKSTLGQPVVEGISPLCDMIGDTVSVKDFSIVDNGQSTTGLGTNSIDGEGHGQHRNPIIENGILKGFLFDSYFGRAYGVESTGNSGRGGGIFGGATPYESSPGVRTKWLEVSGGKKNEDEIISSIDGKAILIRDFPLGIFHTMVATGEFSVVAGSAFLVEDGELKGSVQPVSVSGHFYEGLKNLRDIGSDVTKIPFGIEVPTLVFDGFSIVG